MESKNAKFDYNSHLSTSLIKSNGRQLECAESRNQQFVRKQFGHSLEPWPTDLT